MAKNGRKGSNEVKSGLSKLTELAEGLQEVYPVIGQKVTSAVAELDKLVRQIGWAYGGDCFHMETRGNQDVCYYLCVQRGHDGRCGVYICETITHDLPPPTDDDGHPVPHDQRDLIVVDSRTLRKADELPLPIRVEMLEALDGFTLAYAEYVAGRSRKLLNGSVVPKPKA